MQSIELIGCNKLNFDTSWSDLENGKEFEPSSRWRVLSLKEKYYKTFLPEGATQNQRLELFSP